MASLRTVVMSLLLVAVPLLGGCGGASSNGKVRVELSGTGTPNPPDIAPPAATEKFRLEVLEPDTSERVVPIREVEAKGTGDVTLEIGEIPEGAVVVRIQALDAAGAPLAFYQEPVQVGGGSQQTLQGWLRPGPAPEGLLYVANSGANSMSIVRLTDGQVENLPVSGSPRSLFTVQGKIFATTGGGSLLVVEGVNRSVQVVPLDPGAAEARLGNAAGTRGVLSYPGDPGVRLLDTSSSTYLFTSTLPTGPLARGLSRQVGDRVWVANQGDSTLSEIDVAQEVVAQKLQLGAPAALVEQNESGTRLWALGSAEAPFVRVMEPGGSLVGVFTDRLQAPGGVVVEEGLAYVTDSARGELVVFEDDESPVELDRFSLGDGSPGQMISDGERLYVAMGTTGEIAVVDKATLSVMERYRVGPTPLGMALLR